MLILIGSVNAQQIDFDKCYTDDIGETLLFAFIGLFILSIYLISHFFIKIPFINIILGVAFVFYSASMMLCYTYIGLALFTFGIILILWETIEGIR